MTLLSLNCTDEENQKALQFFNTNYSVVVILEGQSAVFGEREDRTCRFCKKREPETSFRKKAHAFPELIGNRQYFCLDECDKCNEFFSTSLEDHFAKFLGLSRTIMRVKGKKGYPKYSDAKSMARMEWVNGELKVTGVNGKLFTVNESMNEVRVVGEKQPYTPIAVYKTLVKMALSVVDHKYLTGLQNTIDWLLESDHASSKVRISPLVSNAWTIPGRLPFDYPLALVLVRRKGCIVPYMQFVVAFGSLQLQVVIPGFGMDSIVSGKEITMFRFPPAVPMDWEFGKPQMNDFDLSSTSTKRGEKISFTLSYDEIEKVKSGDGGN